MQVGVYMGEGGIVVTSITIIFLIIIINFLKEKFWIIRLVYAEGF